MEDRRKQAHGSPRLSWEPAGAKSKNGAQQQADQYDHWRINTGKR